MRLVSILFILHTEFHSPCSDEGEEDIYDVRPEEEAYDGAQELYEELVSEI